MKRKTAVLLLLTATATGCPKAKEEGATTTTQPSAAPDAASSAATPFASSAVAPDAGAAPKVSLVSVLPTLDVAALCADSALLLVDNRLADAAAKFCASCGPTNPKACSGKWPDDFVAPTATSEARADQMRNTIFAAYGYPFK